MNTHVMLDLETMSLSNNALIISIGAVKFNPSDPGADMDKFEIAVDLNDLPKAYGFDIDPKTLRWWLDADRNDARDRWLQTPKVHIINALDGFRDWYGPDSLPTWSNGAVFDLVVIKNAFDTLGLPCPWSYKHEFCFRTVSALAPALERENFGVAHGALDDAIAQAKHLQKVIAALRLESVF